jgi:hypothetical protein
MIVSILLLLARAEHKVKASTLRRQLEFGWAIKKVVPAGTKGN